jgi:hypothetical protein
MKKEILSLLAVAAGLASTGFASAESTEGYGILFWVFISFGALILLAQIIPAVLVITGFVKGFSAKWGLAKAVKEERGA